METNDDELVNRCLSGDKNAFGEIVIRYQGIVYGWAYHLVGNFEDAKDLAQETFIRAYTRLPDLRDKTKFASWLKKITFSICMNWLKTQERSRFALFGNEANGEDINEIPDSVPSPAEQVEANELRNTVMQALNNLPETYRLPLTLFYLDGLSCRNVAEFLNLSVSTVKWRLHKARKILKKKVLNMVEEVFEEHKPDEKFTWETMEKISVLVADGSSATRDALIKLFDGEDYRVRSIEDAKVALEQLEPHYWIKIVDSKTLGPDALVDEVVEKYPQTPVIMVTAYGTLKEAVEAMKLGAFDIKKPFNTDEILFIVRSVHRKPAAQARQELRPCPKCSRKMQADWQYCPYDGTEIA